MKGKPFAEYRFNDVKTLHGVLPKGLELSSTINIEDTIKRKNSKYY
jgi:hypothetical protein